MLFLILTFPDVQLGTTDPEIPSAVFSQWKPFHQVNHHQ